MAQVRRHIGYMAVTAFIGVTCFNTFIYIAGHTTTAMNLSLIAITFPVFVVLISRVLFKEVLTVKRTAGILIVLTGVVCLITRGDWPGFWPSVLWQGICGCWHRPFCSPCSAF
ncbi:MAG: DMT family transporter [Desulfotignum sp.]|nr:DMT family transporter [Desulfotignum sp.]